MHVRLAQPYKSGRRLKRAIALASLLIAAGSTGCASGDRTDAIQVSWEIHPAEPAVGRLTRTELTITDAGGAPIRHAQLRIEGHMNHPGMAPLVSAAAERGPGVYEAEMRFTMAGPWVLVASATLEDGRRLTRTLDVATVR